ncbi:MAG: hypothetical protein HY332_09425 [Chloroflexi bacterium]|nr:hypothetical protein [Chloroflexota bacterium]
MFGVFFVDSLGFLRLTATPLYVKTSWHAPELAPLLQIAGAYVLGAFIAGVLYAALDERRLFLWIFGTFGLVHLTYTFHTWLLPCTATSVGLPQLYALAVSMYRVVSFAIWADLSTPRTISVVSALGVALSGWTATFLGTAHAMQWRAAALPLEAHFRLVAALAILLFLATLLVTLIQAWRAKAHGRMELHDYRGVP